MENKYRTFSQTAISGPLAKLGAFLRAHPENLYLDEVNIGDKVFNQHLAYPSVK